MANVTDHAGQTSGKQDRREFLKRSAVLGTAAAVVPIFGAGTAYANGQLAKQPTKGK